MEKGCLRGANDIFIDSDIWFYPTTFDPLQLHLNVQKNQETYLPRPLKLVFCTNVIFGLHQRFALNDSSSS
jgi:hypothetical protein